MGYKEILEVAGKIAGIAGLAIGSMLIIFREVIRKNIFPNLTKNQGYKIIRLIIILVWTIAVLGILAWVYSDYLKNNGDSDLTIVDITQQRKDTPTLNISDTSKNIIVIDSLKKDDIIQDDIWVKKLDDTTTVLDIKIRNKGKKVAFVKKVFIKVKNIIPFYESALYGLQPITANYDIVLPVQKTPYTIEKDISQSINTDAADRFTFTISNGYKFYSCAIPPCPIIFVYNVDLILVYDEDDKKITKNDYCFTLGKEYKTLGKFIPVDFDPIENSLNAQSLKSLAKISSKNFSQSVIELIQFYKKKTTYKPLKYEVSSEESFTINDLKKRKYIDLSNHFSEDLYGFSFIATETWAQLLITEREVGDTTNSTRIIDTSYSLYDLRRSVDCDKNFRYHIAIICPKNDRRISGLTVNKHLVAVFNYKDKRLFKRRNPSIPLCGATPYENQWDENIASFFQ